MTLLSRFWKRPRGWAWPSELRRRGVLGINRRNGDFILPHNPRAFYPRVDDKCLTKAICLARGIPVPMTYAVIDSNAEVFRFLDLIGNHQDFVVKPAKGSAGRGIMVIDHHDGEVFHTSSGEHYRRADLTYHMATILSGLYSLAGQPDRLLIEQRIVRHEVFQKIAVGGTPDVRVVLYRCVPVMAMVRLPTQASRGRANLHQGAAAAGIHLAHGCTFGGVFENRAISHHPDTGAPIQGLQIPMWRELLVAAMKLADGLGLDYLGVDFVLDARLGPVVLEANARPGLNIQVANRCGLLDRLRYVDSHRRLDGEAERRLELVSALAKIV